MHRHGPIALVEPFTMREDRLTQVDVRLTKIVRLGRVRLKGMFDLYNLFNANTVLIVNNTYGPAWQQPLGVVAGRLAKFSGQIDF